MTIEWIIVTICFGLLGVIISVFAFKEFGILRGIITTVVVGAILGIDYWICNNTA